MTRIVIIGAGVIGAAIAYELSAIPAFQLTLLEKQQGVTELGRSAAEGATGAALGVMMGVISHKTKGRAWRLRQATLERFDNLVTELEQITGESLPVNRQGILKVIPTEEQSQWQRLQQTRAAQGYPLELWSFEQLREQFPYLKLNPDQSAVYSPRDRQINPQHFTEQLLKAAQSQGVTYGPGVTVHHLAHRDGICTGLETSQGFIEADQVIIAAGLGSPALTPFFDPPIALQPVLGQGLRVKLPQPLGLSALQQSSVTSRQPVITCNDVHLVPWGDKEYAIAATVEFPHPDGTLIADPQRLESIYHQAIALCPDLAQGERIYTWQGTRPRPLGESAPILRSLPGFTNVLLATGHYRNGILLAPATALWVKQTLTA
ncbi:MAG: FAD-dependent oxidoreductase [Merismopediaceae bacterium]|nr:FAD-dependent oxidoreductase [Merismopediaceae bacterium]